MIDKISIEFKNMLKNKYNAYLEKQDNGIINIYIFNGCYSCKDVHNFKNTLKQYEGVLNTMSIYGEKLINTYLKNNKIWMTIETKEMIKRETTIGGYNKMLKSRVNFMKVVENNGHELLTTYIDAKEKVLIDFKCGHNPHCITPNTYLGGTRCPVCSNKKIIPYVNDCYTLRPDLLKYFINENDAIGIGISDKTIRNFQCPNCGYIRENYIANIACFGFSCPVCSDGLSYPNKFMFNLLRYLKIDFEKEKHFDWCRYIDNNGDLCNGYYDFFIPSKKLIIEMDGRLHYKNGFWKEYEEIKAIDRQKDLLATEHNYSVIRIDCGYKSSEDRFTYIKNNIFLKLHNVIDLLNVDWDYINIQSNRSIKLEAINMWNNDLTIGTYDIANILNMTPQSVIHYLHEGNSECLCDFSKKEQYRRKQQRIHDKFNIYIKVLKDDEIIGVFFDYYKFVEKFNDCYKENQIIRKQAVMNVVKGKAKSYKGFVFKEIDRKEYELLVQDNILITDKEMDGI